MSSQVSLNQIWSVPLSELQKIARYSSISENLDIKKLRVEVAKVYLKSGNLSSSDIPFVNDPRFAHILSADELVEGLETLSPPPQEEKSMVNEDLAKHFDKLNALYTENNDVHRGNTFGRGATFIRSFPGKITSGKQLSGIKGLGPATYNEIDAFLANPMTTRLSELMRQVPSAEKNMVIELFEKVHGIGPVKAGELYNQGYRRLDQLTNLTHAQQLGIKYYLHFNERIPRSEIIEYDILLTTLLPSDLVWLIAGSYRRGKSSSGDIDLIFKSEDPNYLNVIVSLLIERGVIVDTLALGPSKFMGVVTLGPNRIYRRIDIRIFTEQEWAYGILYNTGSFELNKEMRTRAITKDLSLNEFALVQVDSPYMSYPAKTERDIFTLLEMEYLLPRFRG